MATEGALECATVTVNYTARTPLRRIWRYFGYDEPNYTYTTNGNALLTKLATLSDGPYYIRCHFILCSGDGTPRLKWGSTNVYTEDAAGNPCYTWDLIDRILDGYVNLGLTPFVELGFTPQALSTAPPDVPYNDPRHGGWRYPPKDYGRWLELVRNLASHCRERYGPAEVAKWYWELWNEPDIFYWTGSVQDYCRLYDYTVAGLTAALPQARIGGPATTSSTSRSASSAFLRSFLDHVTRGENHLTGEVGTRIDFISYHAKGGGFSRDPDAAKKTPTLFTLLGNVQCGLDIVGEYPELAGVELILSECDPDGWAAGTIHDNPNLFYRNTEYYASFVAATVNKLMNRKATNGVRVDGMLTWAFLFEGRDYFEGFRALSTNGIDKAVLNVFRLLAKMGGVHLALSSDRTRDPVDRGRADADDDLPDISGLAALDASDGVQVFLSSHHDDWAMTTASEVHVSVVNVETNRRYAIHQTLVAQHSGSAYSVWDQMGRPQRPTEAQLRSLQDAARPKPLLLGEVDSRAGTVELKVMLPSHCACLLQLIPI